MPICPWKLKIEIEKNDLILIMTPEKKDKTLELSKHWSADSTPARNEVIMKRTNPVKLVSATKSAVIINKCMLYTANFHHWKMRSDLVMTVISCFFSHLQWEHYSLLNTWQNLTTLSDYKTVCGLYEWHNFYKCLPLQVKPRPQVVKMSYFISRTSYILFKQYFEQGRSTQTQSSLKKSISSF